MDLSHTLPCPLLRVAADPLLWPCLMQPTWTLTLAGSAHGCQLSSIFDIPGTSGVPVGFLSSLWAAHICSGDAAGLQTL